jgi:hypothetical protein
MAESEDCAGDVESAATFGRPQSMSALAQSPWLAMAVAAARCPRLRWDC